MLLIGMICKHPMTKYLLVEVDGSGRSNVPATSFDGLGGSNFLGKPFEHKTVSLVEYLFFSNSRCVKLIQ